MLNLTQCVSINLRECRSIISKYNWKWGIFRETGQTGTYRVFLRFITIEDSKHVSKLHNPRESLSLSELSALPLGI